MRVAGGRSRHLGEVGALALAMTLASSVAVAGDRAYDIRGDGGITCATWTAYRRDNGLPAIAAANWVMGYLTAYDEYVGGGHIGAGVDNDTISVWVDTYCEVHPLDNLATAASHLIDDLRARNR